MPDLFMHILIRSQRTDGVFKVSAALVPAGGTVGNCCNKAAGAAFTDLVIPLALVSDVLAVAH